MSLPSSSTVDTVSHATDVMILEKRVSICLTVDLACSLCKPTSFFFGGPQTQFIEKVLNLNVVLRRRGTYSVTVQKTVKIPQMQLLDKLMTSVVVQRLVPGRDSADNCGGAAVAWGPCGDSAGAVLGQV